MPLPQRGNGIVFQPLDHLQAIEYKRPPTSDLGFCNNYLASFKAAEVFLSVLIDIRLCSLINN
jgi:hypothetical protein